MKSFTKFTFIGVILSTLFLAGCSDETSNSNIAKNATNSGMIIASTPTNYDWGDINIQGGKVDHTFSFTNNSDEPLYLRGAQTSCMCTTARYRFADDSISPQYGMHNNPTSWRQEIASGDSFEVEVFFDPMAHGPKATGPIVRDVTLLTSASNGPVLKLKVSGNVLSEDDYKAKEQ